MYLNGLTLSHLKTRQFWWLIWAAIRQSQFMERRGESALIGSKDALHCIEITTAAFPRKALMERGYKVTRCGYILLSTVYRYDKLSDNSQ